MRPNAVASLLLAASTLALSAAELGMAAPELTIASWAKGGPVDLKSARDKGVTVVEFWATWCPPCRATIPHLSQLQARFKDQGVTFVGISDETPAKVKPFVEKMGDQMAYTVAIDDSRKTTAAYMEAFGVNGIPHAFIVDKQGRIAWHGHPMAGLDKTLEAIVSGKYDIESAQRGARAEKTMREYFELVADGQHSPKSKDLGEAVLRDAAESPELMNQFAWILLTHPRLKNPDHELAARAAKSAFDRTEGKDASILDTYARSQFLSGKTKEAIELQKKAIELCAEPEMKPKLEKSLKEYEAKLN